MTDELELDREEAEADMIDDALGKMIDEVIGDDVDDDEFDEVSDILFDVIADLVDNDEIKDIPALDAAEEEKQEWLSTNLPVLKSKLKEALEDDSDLE